MNRRITYPTQGTCSRFIDVELDEQGVIRDVVFTGGCHGNLQGISSLVKGQKAENVISRIEGIRCGNKSTSCPDQLAKALRKAME
ncbi:MAG: TIGR03905 family TSCPD domain-containing protein [Prevotella sp.]|jgi:uncharacterized protein (TIGR03905 family)|nr:TIGR03905 family TSCPD domain-containing protein [Prevotella sp.]MBP3745688.1 TIGR03905 family TSCPD domain-containing protein [Prevotella sp.]MBQ1854149.1 TIGR03905 family TSCPD domain-containing protein [Prevotella sp.]MBQ2060403.1 TIGR03905 family TSCPD domain-containing protein [Prevotella sp.]MBQ2338495.1 TIGR03905 family TSCPD domain-containing protein [Prevotella sp.]